MDDCILYLDNMYTYASKDPLNIALCPILRHQWKSELNTYRVEAAWKLGKWDLLEEYLSSGNKTH